jgi:hypothetical protein
MHFFSRLSILVKIVYGHIFNGGGNFVDSEVLWMDQVHLDTSRDHCEHLIGGFEEVVENLLVVNMLAPKFCNVVLAFGEEVEDGVRSCLLYRSDAADDMPYV